MSPEYKVVINQRRGRKFEQLRIDKGIPLVDRVEITSKYFDVEINKVISILEEAGDVLVRGQASVLTEEQKDLNLGRRLDTYFMERLRDLGISQTHSTNLLRGVVDYLALGKGPRESQDWKHARVELYDRFRQKIR